MRVRFSGRISGFGFVFILNKWKVFPPARMLLSYLPPYLQLQLRFHFKTPSVLWLKGWNIWRNSNPSYRRGVYKIAKSVSVKITDIEQASLKNGTSRKYVQLWPPTAKITRRHSCLRPQKTTGVTLTGHAWWNFSRTVRLCLQEFRLEISSIRLPWKVNCGWNSTNFPFQK